MKSSFMKKPTLLFSSLVVAGNKVNQQETWSQLLSMKRKLPYHFIKQGIECFFQVVAKACVGD
jgi:hypothetical protein